MTTPSPGTWRVLILAAAVCCALCGQDEVDRAAAARKAIGAGDYARAERLYRELSRSQPRSAEALSNLGLALSQQGKSSEAIVVFRQSLAIKEAAGTLALLGLNYCRVRDYEHARGVLRSARRYWSNPDVLALLGPCYLEAGEALDAVKVYQGLVRLGTEGQDEHAANLARAGWEASRHFTQLLGKASGSEPYRQAIRAARDEAAPDARGAMPLALRNAPYLKRGMDLAEMGALLKTHRSDPALLYVLAVACGEQAIQAYLYCREHFPGSVAARRLQAELLASQGRDEAAVSEYETLLRDAPRSPELHHALAMLYRRLGDWERALAQFQQERQAAPDDERALAGVSECLLRLNRFEEVRRLLTPVIASSSSPEWALLDLAAAEESLDHFDGAIRALEGAARQEPQNQAVHYRLMRLYRLANRTDLAEKEAAIFRRLKTAPVSK